MKLTFGTALRDARKHRGMTQEDLAKRAEISEPFISQLESGARLPSYEVQVKLAKALSMTISDLMEGVR